jgi:DNA-packaging protein gp3
MANIGRPTKYTPELIDKAHRYITDFNHYGAVFPSHIGLALYLGLHTDTIYAWQKEEGKEEFSGILGQISQIQHEMLVGNGISGDFNPAITKLVLGKHGYHEKQQTELTGADGGPISTTTKVLSVVGIAKD